ncbi:hypothetical protein ACSBR1_022483 [Camellia fascicularis]
MFIGVMMALKGTYIFKLLVEVGCKPLLVIHNERLNQVVRLSKLLHQLYFFLAPGDMHGFRFLTISVAPSPTVSGRPPPAASMAVGQIFSPKDGELELSSQLLLLSTYSPKDIILEDHPLAFNMSFAISLGLFPVKLSLETTGCGIKKSVLLLKRLEIWRMAVDPHCSYKASVAVPVIAAAKSFLLLYGSEVKISTALIC